ncbi:hypothetical protein CDV55_100445 [Aspergillus turcosus]|uniref:ferric-chelate reductase (NADPH) n=1 Tax=Aspergillus turcosus TaxID=1245748 RepID=A0A229YEG6_9EURO|nr:hypothetical protein CDV55_100445 [Aspergillus turcosus]RLL92985.1 hypothetical protein CFD26_101068 [Aspergillus turcosus]
MLSSDGVDFSNITDASNFLGDLLDDTDYQVDGNARARYFWYGIAALIGVTAIGNLAWRLDLRSRKYGSPSSDGTSPGIFDRATAASMRLLRRATYLQLTPTRNASWFKIPPLGIVYLILAYILFILLLEFVDDLGVTDPTWWTLVGVRAAWLAMAQLPLIVLLVGKHSLIGLLIGVSYERLNVLHRWVARGMFLLLTLHAGFLGTAWNRYPGLQSLEWETDEAFRTGVAAYAIVFWMIISALAPLRHLSWEFFVVQHIITFLGLIIAIGMHIPGSAKYARVWIYVAVALYLVERLVYFVRLTFTISGRSRVALEPLEGDVTKMRVTNPRIRTWAPGSHVMVGIPRFGLIQSHPATIMSIPSSHNGEMVLLLRAYKGFTRRIHENKHGKLKESGDGSSQERQPRSDMKQYVAVINGPYGASHAQFVSFETVILIAGATGVTFTLSILLDLAHRAALAAEKGDKPYPVRKLIFVWLIRKAVCIEWISEELRQAASDLEKAGISFELQVYVTRSDSEEATLSNSPALAPLDSTKEATQKPHVLNTYHSISGLSLNSGRPTWKDLLHRVLSEAQGESGVGVCGPLSLSVEVRKEVVSLSAHRARRIYMHVESFS